MNTSQCCICETRYLSNSSTNVIQPWNCPNCNNDCPAKIQRDLNELFKHIGFKAISRIAHRANRHLSLSQMYKKGDDQPIDVSMG